MGQIPEDVHTTLRVGGGLTRIPPQEARESIIDPPSDAPIRRGLRFSPTTRLLGQLERLAKARFYIRELTDDDVISAPGPESYWIVAQSVNASSEIEGEHVQAQYLELVLAPRSTIREEQLDAEETMRLKTTRSIIDACYWALQYKDPTIVSYEFVMDLHRRMFLSTHSGIAGKPKSKDVWIRGAGYNVKTLPPAKVDEALKALCARTTQQFVSGHDSSETSMFLCAAEFVCDFLVIHPFADGNGRTSRILSTYLLERAGYHFARYYPLEQVILETKPRYYEALFQAQRRWYHSDEDITVWIEYYTSSVFEQWERALRRVREQSRREMPR
ncbi:MAG: Fic family protein [Planctomycetes bacterium]|nr:Fic family protein [Planctomycetota bacterium]